MTTRHPLNRGGHRQANAALYRTVIVRMQHHEPTKAYLARQPLADKLAYVKPAAACQVTGVCIGF